MDDIVVVAIAMITLGQVSLCLSILLTRALTSHVYLPLAVFFLANGVIAVVPALFSFSSTLATQSVALLLPALLLLGPALWLYVEGLTSEQKWALRIRQLWHLLPFGLGLVSTVLILGLSDEARHALFIEGKDVESGPALVAIIYAFSLIVLWPFQSGYYVVRILRRLTRYRQQLKALFASNEQRELGWISGVIVIIGGIWLLFLASLLSSLLYEKALFGYRSGCTLYLLLIWFLATWGLRQKPGFEGRYLNDELKTVVAEAIDKKQDKKYERSALDNEHAQRIAGKISHAMEEDQLFLDPSISLQKLSQHISVSPNYISQTLNETIGLSFFDYVNKSRIDKAKPLIASGENTVHDIALMVGFNARSSFYKAFKRETGVTPGDYRKTNGNSQ